MSHRHRWCTSADLRRTQIESGADITFNEVFKPLFVQRICALRPKKVIEVGAGTGHLSKAISGHGFSLTTIEPSKGMFRIAQEVLDSESVDLKNCSSFELPPSETFNVAFSHMVAHVVEDLPGFSNSIAIHLSQKSHFIFSIPHPCFYNNYKKFFGEEYSYMKRMMKEVSFSITKDPENLISDVPYYHRPLSDYINALVEAGSRLTDLMKYIHQRRYRESMASHGKTQDIVSLFAKSSNNAVNWISTKLCSIAVHYR